MPCLLCFFLQPLKSPFLTGLISFSLFCSFKFQRAHPSFVVGVFPGTGGIRCRWEASPSPATSRTMQSLCGCERELWLWSSRWPDVGLACAGHDVTVGIRTSGCSCHEASPLSLLVAPQAGGVFKSESLYNALPGSGGRRMSFCDCFCLS